MPEMVQRQRGIWNYVALRVVALQGPRERLLAGIDPTALSHAREKADLTARAWSRAHLAARTRFSAFTAIPLCRRKKG